MDWPGTPVEYLGAFKPPFCPWRDCAEHHRTRPGYRFRKHASYSTQRKRHVPRFRCRTCGRTFSRQTFSVTYYRKRPELLEPIAAGIVAGSAFRQLARSLGCGHSTVARAAAHLGRHALLLQAHTLAQLDRVAEPCVFDHFETFEFTQDCPFGIATAVGAESWFVYALDPAPHGRAGRRSAAQQRRVASRPRRPTRGGYRGSARRVLDLLLSLETSGAPLALTSDGHTDYQRAVREHPHRRRIHHTRFPNPPRGPKGAPRSPAARERDRAMFPVDLLHRLLRHSLAHQRRETIAFGRRLNAVMERMFLTAVWRNFVKRRSERRRDGPTPAMSLGLADSPWPFRRVLSRRLFFDRIRLPRPWPSLYRREWDTPILTANARHALKLAF